MKLSKQSHNPPSSAPLQSLARGAMFLRPDHLEPSPWLDYLPWLFWLLEVATPARCVTLGARRGSPHLALCQGVSQLNLETECLLVSDGKDETAQDVQASADRRYGALSRQLMVDPRRAARQLEAGSVDILALDLALDDEDMEDVLDRWLSRLSERGVVLIPGINRREPGCLSFDQFAKMQHLYHSITFHHGDGLGVVFVGEHPPELLQTLLTRWNAPTAARTVREVFARLGRACADQVAAEQQTSRLRSATTQLDSLAQESEEQGGRIARLTADLEERDRYLQGVESDKLHLAEEAADAQRSVQSLQTELAQANAHIADMETARQEAELQQKRLEETVIERDENIQTRFRELATMTNIAEEADQQRESFKQKALVFSQRNEEKKLEIKELRRMRLKLEQEVNGVETRNQEMLSQLESRATFAEESKKSLERDVVELKKLLKKREKSLASRFDELGDLTAAMEEKERELQSLREQINPTPLAGQPRQRKSGFTGGRLPLPGLGAKSEKRREQLRQRKRQQETIAEIESSEFFDGRWYLAQYPDLYGDADYASNPALHYLKFGGFEGRNPSPNFDSAGYLEAYPDVALTGINPLLHYIRDGVSEGREPRP